MTISTFFRTLWPNTVEAPSSFLTLWQLQGPRSYHFSLRDFETGLAEAEAHAIRQNDAGYEMYFGVGLRDQDLGFKLGLETQVIAWPGLWLDIDIQHESAHAGSNLPPSLDAVEEALLLFQKKGGVEPSLIVHSGFGLHVYYLLDKPFVVDHPADRDSFKKALQRFQRQFGAALDELGKWDIDNTAKLQQVLRLPTLLNRKVPSDIRTVEILVDDGPRYALEQLERVTIRGRGRPNRLAKMLEARGSSASPGSTTPNGATGDVPLPEGEVTWADVAAASEAAQAPKKRGRPPSVKPEGQLEAEETPKKRGRPPEQEWFHEVRRRARRISDKHNHELAMLLMAGEPFAQAGRRNDTCNKVVGIVCALTLRVKEDVTEQEIYDQFFRESIDAMAALENDPSNPALHEELVVDQIARSLEDLREQAVHRADAERRMAETLTRLAARKGKPLPPNNGNGHGGGNGGGNGGAGPFVDEPGVAVEHERVNGHANGHALEFGAGGVPEFPVLNGPEDIRSALRLLVIQFQSHFYILKDGKYQFPVSKDGVENRLRDDLVDEDAVTWDYENDKGDIKRKTLPHFLRDYCTTARHVVLDLTVQESYYDVETCTFVEAPAPLRQLTPEYNDEIHTWLQLLGGVNANRLIDWISTITDLTSQNCALYLSGSGDTGKTVLAHGLARLWVEHGPPTDLKNALAAFNSDIANCPFIVADEHLPKDCTSADLRALVGTSARTMTRKYFPNSILRGAVRLMLMANNERLLQINSNEEQDATDIDAVVGRFLHIPVDPAAADYLRSIGGKFGNMRGWIDDSQIARHALWLRDNLREDFIPGTRFLVEGSKTAVHRQMVLQSSVVAVVAEWLIRFLLKPVSSIRQMRLAICERDALYVNAFALSDFWEQYITSSRVFSTHKIGKALRAISKGDKRIDTKRYYNIDLEILFEWAERFELSDTDVLLRQVQQLAGPHLVA